jgi:hypothetical protein
MGANILAFHLVLILSSFNSDFLHFSNYFSYSSDSWDYGKRSDENNSIFFWYICVIFNDGFLLNGLWIVALSDPFFVTSQLDIIRKKWSLPCFKVIPHIYVDENQKNRGRPQANVICLRSEI